VRRSINASSPSAASHGHSVQAIAKLRDGASTSRPGNAWSQRTIGQPCANPIAASNSTPGKRASRGRATSAASASTSTATPAYKLHSLGFTLLAATARAFDAHASAATLRAGSTRSSGAPK
jgi:hypothetical protein